MSAFSERDREAARVLAGYLETRVAELEAERDDYERRWLAECRAHGETRRALDALRATAPLACESCGHTECTCLESFTPGY